MREIHRQVREALLGHFPEKLVDQLVESYSKSVQQYQNGDHKTCLNEAGFFCEHVLRALVFEMSSSVPAEIKRFADVVTQLGKTTNMPEATRLLIPKILYSSVYEMRSKRGAVHFKGVDPQKRDAAQAISAMSWVLAEMLAHYGNLESNALDRIIDSLLQRPTPLVEHIGGERVVTRQLQAHIETLLMIDSHPEGVSRRELGRLVKRSPSSVTHALVKLEKERLAHKNSNELWFVTNVGERFLEKYL